MLVRNNFEMPGVICVKEFKKHSYWSDGLDVYVEEVINDFCLQLETCGIKPLTLELKP